MTQPSTEEKIVWGIGRFFKNLFSGGGKSTSARIDREEVRRRWQEIEDSMKAGGPNNFKAAVIDADKLLDYCLKNIGAYGETLGERLKNSENKFHDRAAYQAAWEGHKERNRLVHEHNYEFLHHQAVSTINNFKKALNELGVI